MIWKDSQGIMLNKKKYTTICKKKSEKEGKNIEVLFTSTCVFSSSIFIK